MIFLSLPSIHDSLIRDAFMISLEYALISVNECALLNVSLSYCSYETSFAVTAGEHFAFVFCHVITVVSFHHKTFGTHVTPVTKPPRVTLVVLT